MEFSPQVDPEHYRSLSYDTKERFISYWMQVHEVARLHPERVLEIGIGSGFVHRYLRSLGHAVHTVDADARLEPDTVALVTELPFDTGSFDVVCCFETLEHLPWEEFEPAVRSMARVSRRWVLLSLPDVTPYARVRVEWGFRHTRLSKFFDLPNRNPATHEYNGEHYWELGKRGYPLSRLVERLEHSGLVVEATPRIEEDPWHRFFRCHKE